MRACDVLGGREGVLAVKEMGTGMDGEGSVEVDMSEDREEEMGPLEKVLLVTSWVEKVVGVVGGSRLCWIGLYGVGDA